MLDGKACGALKIHSWYALPTKPRGCLGWSWQNQDFSFDRVLVDVECKHDFGSFHVDGLNRDWKTDEAIIFTPVFHRTTLTDPKGEELIVKKGKVVEVRTYEGSSSIPENGYVLSLHENHPLFGAFQIGTNITFSMNIQPQIHKFSKKKWDNYEFILGGTPLLIDNKVKITNFSGENTIPTFLTYRHSRTAVGILPNGHWLFVVVDKTGIFDGLTIEELTHLMDSLGCIYALNVDGGGSSTLVYKHEVKNSPHGDEDEGGGKQIIRRVSDALLVTPQKTSLDPISIYPKFFYEFSSL